MKKLILLLFTVSINLSTLADNWEVSSVYEKKDVPINTQAVDQYNNIHDVQYILVPHKLEKGEYKVTVSEVSSTLLKIEGTNLYLKMKGDKMFKPCSMINPKAEVKLIIDWSTSKIVYKGMFGEE